MTIAGPKRAWATLLTRSSYLPGVITLAYSLSKQKTIYPLIVLITPSLPAISVRALELELKHNPLLHIHPTEPLLPPSNHKPSLIATRFEDTWTKLRVFELTFYDAVIFLDADITIFRNMDDAFDIALPGPEWLAATHSCVCNLDHDSWAPENWKPENCSYTPLTHPSAMTNPTLVPHSSDGKCKQTHTLLNGGMFIFHPSTTQHSSLMHAFNTSPRLSSYMFPDQDFLADFFRDKWLSIGWQFNALKTMRYWHEQIWRDDEVRALHYIVDKPWTKRIATDWVAGYLGRDGVTHRWWWEIWAEWLAEREGEEELLRTMEELVAGELDDEGERRQVEEHKAKGLPVPVPEHLGARDEQVLATII